MAPVQIKASSRTGNFVSSTTTWAAHALFAHRMVISQGVGTSVAQIGNATTTEAQAQSITPAAAFDLTEVRIVIAKVGSPTDNVSVTIQSDASSKPSGTVLATADNVYSGANISTTNAYLSFQFLTPLSLSASTKYWIVVERSGAIDSVNYFTVSTTTTNPYTSGGRSSRNAGVWGSESATSDFAFNVIQKAPIALYAITSDTALHMFKSTDLGASWTEQDSAHAPTTASSTAQFDATQSRTGPYIATARMTAANTANVRIYNPSTDLWDTADFGTTPPSAVSGNRPMRISVENLFTTAAIGVIDLQYTDSVDDADLAYQRVSSSGGSWSAQTLFLSVTAATASNINDVIVDKVPNAFRQALYSDVANADFSIRSIQSTTFGTETDLDATAMGTAASFITATYMPYQSSSAVDTIVCAYVDLNGDLIERILTLEATSASVGMATATTVDTGGFYTGRSVTTARYNGTNYIAWAAASTLVYVTSSSPGSWSGSTTWKSGLTSNPILSNMLPIEGTGLAAIYTDNSTNVQFDWIVPPVTTSTRTATPVTIALQSTSTRSATATIALQGTLTRTASATIALQKLNTTRTATPVTISLALVSTRTASATIALQATLTRTATPVTIALIGTLTRSASATIALQKLDTTRTASATIALSLQKTRAATPVTMALQATLTRTASATIALSQVRTRTATPVTVALSLTSTRTATATIALSATSTRTSAATIALSQVRSRTATPVTVALSLETTRSASATIALIGTLTRTATATIALSSTAGGGTRTATPVTIALSASNITRTATPVTIALSTPDKTRTATPVTVALQATSTRTATATIALSQARTRTSTATIALSQQRTRTATATIALSATLTRSAPATIALSQVRTRTSTPVTIALSLTKTRTASATIALSLTKTRTATPVTLALSLVSTRTATATVALSLTRTRTATVTIALSILAPIVVPVPSAEVIFSAPVPMFGSPGATAAWDQKQGAGLYTSSQSGPTGTRTQDAGIEGSYGVSPSGITGTRTQDAGVGGTARKTDQPPTGEVS